MVGDGMQSLQTEAFSIISSAMPVVLIIAGAVLAVFIGLKLFKRFGRAAG
jgi:hypothetical protein